MIKELSEEEFLTYFKSPMKVKENQKEIDLSNYLEEILKHKKIDKEIDELGFGDVYEDADQRYEHHNISYGVENKFIVLIVEGKEILGFYHLDLNKKYGNEN